MEDHNRKTEQQRVDRVIGLIDEQIRNLEQQVNEKKADIVNLRKNFWNDVSVNFDDMGEAAETYRSIKQQAENLSERERMQRHAENQLDVLRRLRKSPYFGRIDFREEGDAHTEQIYLGIASFYDEDSEQFLVYDWRAPVSSLYYDYPPGPADYETPSGSIHGEIELKRQYVIRDGHIRSLFDTGVTIGDELLQEVLGKQSDAQMKSIVATIQKEQNRIIRNERSRLLIVQGAAGSGKTSAALQRAAYLLYRFRKTLRSDNIVLFSPNPMFNSYIATVLPELGEENVQQTTFQEYLEHRLSRQFKIEDPFVQMEYVYSSTAEAGYDAKMQAISYKATADFMQIIDRYAAYLKQAGMKFKDVKFRGETIISADNITQKFYEYDTAMSIPNRVRELTRWLSSELKAAEEQERTKPWVEDEIELLDKEDYVHAYQQLRGKRGYTDNSFNDHDRERDLLAAMVVQRQFKPVRQKVKRRRFIDTRAVYRQLFENHQFISQLSSDPLPSQWSDICSSTIQGLDSRELAYEDATPYLYLKELIEGFQTNTAVRHVFIDEAQDYSPFQFAFIKRLFPFCKLTVLGDINQAIYAHSASSNGFDTLQAMFEPEETETILLTRSYRSTHEIVEFTKQLLPEGRSIVPFNRHGDKPTVTMAADDSQLASKIAARIKSLQSSGYQSIAVICKTFEESQAAFELLRDKVELRLIGKETASFKVGTVVIPAYLAKGVEFDAVVIHNASHAQYGRENERKLFYTACTRAMHELHICFIGEISPFITEVSADTYNQQD